VYANPYRNRATDIPQKSGDPRQQNQKSFVSPSFWCDFFLVATFAYDWYLEKFTKPVGRTAPPPRRQISNGGFSHPEPDLFDDN
jgi:hypothetical protein